MCDESEDTNSGVALEIETLRSIYVNELDVKYNETFVPISVAVQLYPATADNVEEKYVRMTLIFELPMEYPECIPEIEIRNPRGLSDEKLNRIKEDLISVAESQKGGHMLFELIETAKEYLTTDNRPSGACAICLYEFSESDLFMKTECYHYFHLHCLSRHVHYSLKSRDEKEPNEAQHVEQSSSEEGVLCPVCRLPITYNAVNKDYSSPPCSENEFVITPELSDWQKEMKILYQKQLCQGGIIDIEAEKNKYLLEISNVPSQTTAESPATVPENAGKADSLISNSKASNLNNEKRTINHTSSSRTNNYKKYNEKSFRERNLESRPKWHSRNGESKKYPMNSELWSERKETSNNNVEKEEAEENVKEETVSYSGETTDDTNVEINEKKELVLGEEETETKLLKESSDSEFKNLKKSYQSESSYRRPPQRGYNNYNRWNDKPRYNGNKSYPNDRNDYRYNSSESFRHSSSGASSRYNSYNNRTYKYENDDKYRRPASRNSYRTQDSKNQTKSENSQDKLDFRNRSDAFKPVNPNHNRKAYLSSLNNYGEKNYNDYSERNNYGRNFSRKQYASEKSANGHDIQNKNSDVGQKCESQSEVSSKDSYSAASSEELKICRAPPPGFANPLKKVIYGLPSVNPPPGFHQS